MYKKLVRWKCDSCRNSAELDGVVSGRHSPEGWTRLLLIQPPTAEAADLEKQRLSMDLCVTCTSALREVLSHRLWEVATTKPAVDGGDAR